MVVRLLAALWIAAIAFIAPSLAQFAGPTARTAADLNMRSGAGVGFRVIAVIPRGHPVRVIRCPAPATWCNVAFRNLTGWVSARYLSPRPGLSPQPLPPAPPFPPPGSPFPPFLPPPQSGPGFPQPPVGSVTVVGTLTPGGVECQAMRGDDGRLYTLTGGTGPFQNGNRVRVLGRIAQMSFCMQGTTIEVQAIQPAF